jgi:hypothetical protein
VKKWGRKIRTGRNVATPSIKICKNVRKNKDIEEEITKKMGIPQ